MTPSNREQLKLVSHSLRSVPMSSFHQTATGRTAQPNYEQRLTTPAHLDRIEQIARKQTRGSNVDWQDALQTAQIKLIVSIRAGKFSYGTEQDFDRWATTVARFEIIDLVRKSKCREWDSIDRALVDNLTVLETISDPFNPLTALETADLVVRVRAAILDLDKR